MDIRDEIAEASPEALAEIMEVAIERLGDLGRAGAEPLLARLRGDDRDLLTEGLAQLNAIEGVLDGRLDRL